MSSNVGLSTPRGSGTSGYVQRNLSVLKPRSTGAGAPYSLDAARGPKQRKPDQDILAHDRLRAIEVKVLELRDRLEDEDVDEDEVDEKCEKLRQKLIVEMEGTGKRGGTREAGPKAKGLKGYQVHELAEAKAVESERLRRALGLRGDGGVKDGEEDGEHPMARQERRKREREMERAREEEEKYERDGGRAREYERSP